MNRIVPPANSKPKNRSSNFIRQVLEQFLERVLEQVLEQVLENFAPRPHPIDSCRPARQPSLAALAATRQITLAPRVVARFLVQTEAIGARWTWPFSLHIRASIRAGTG